MARIKRIGKILFAVSKLVITLSGITFTFILASISLNNMIGRTNSTAFPSVDRLINGELAYVWIGISVVFIIGMLVDMVVSVKNGLKRQKKDSATITGIPESFHKKITRWFLTH